MSIIACAAAGQEKLTPPEISKIASPEWKAMTPEERIARTKPAIDGIEARHQSKELGTHNVPIAAFQDFTKTMSSISAQVCYQKHSFTQY